jgi:hypothetical protein
MAKLFLFYCQLRTAATSFASDRFERRVFRNTLLTDCQFLLDTMFNIIGWQDEMETRKAVDKSGAAVLARFPGF